MICLIVKHIFCVCVLHQMNDIMLYTYPQQDGKYRLKNTLSLSGMKVRSCSHFSDTLTVFACRCVTEAFLPLTHPQVSKPVLDNVQNCLRIEVSDITITLSAR